MFDTVLIANRGEIAVRIIDACRALNIRTVAVYSDADTNALHVARADTAVRLGPAPAPASYLRIDRILAAARQSGAQAIHPGYGFLAERAAFARACETAGLVFIGPPASAIERLGDKAAAKQLAEAEGVPTAPGYSGADQRAARLSAEAERIGFPLLIKASAGGGGKGMRTVWQLADLPEALAAAQREALAAFGADAVLLERLIVAPRHVEIQVLADSHGHAVHLFERECSVQRRHQKIIEESPSPALTPALRASMGADAVRLALTAGYVNAGTCEFLLAADGSYYFLEMNTRLQVEHPITEAVTGLDLVQLQLRVAAGEPLPFTQADLRQRGHAFEARLCAEDPLTLLPTTGTLRAFAPPPTARTDTGVRSGDVVTVNYDSLLAKVIVHGPDRATALTRFQAALADTVALGVTTNLALLQAVAAHPAFAAGETTTDFLERHDLAAQLDPDPPPPLAALVAAALIHSSPAPGAAPWETGGWRFGGNSVRLVNTRNPARAALQRVTGGWRAQVAETQAAVTGVIATEQELHFALDDVPQRAAYAWDGSDLLVQLAGVVYQFGPDAPPAAVAAGGSAAQGGLSAPMPGTVLKVLAAVGAAVSAQQPLVVLEAMKMEYVVAAPADGVVSAVHCRVGEQVRKGAVLIEM